MAETALDDDEHVPSAGDPEQVALCIADLYGLVEGRNRRLHVYLAGDERWPKLLDARSQLEATAPEPGTAICDVVEQLDGSTRFPAILERDARQAFELEAPWVQLREQRGRPQQEGHRAVVVPTPHRSLTGSSESYNCVARKLAGFPV
jgi:hypothetical protein